MSLLIEKGYHFLEKVSEKKYLSFTEDQKKKALGNWYRLITKEELHLDNPLNFNEKMQWMKIYDNSPIKTVLSDKYQVRAWVKDTIGEDYLIGLIGNWSNADDIPFEDLPKKYVLKANHGSGMNYIVRDNEKENYNELRKLARKWLKTPSGIFSMEQQYFRIPRRIIAEEYISQDNNGTLLDYKIHCFNGKPRFVQVIGDRNIASHTAKEAYFDLNWTSITEMHNIYGKMDNLPEKPKNYELLIDIAKQLSKDFIYVRVDLYDVNNRILFGEMTFTPAEGLGRWARHIPDEWWK